MTITAPNPNDGGVDTWMNSVASLLNGDDRTTYTPTIAGTGWAKGNGTVGGYYVVVGGRCYFSCYITFGTTSTYGAGSPRLSLPVAANASWAGVEANTWQGTIVDSSTGGQYDARSVSYSTTEFSVYALLETGTYEQAAALSSTAPMTWASGDSIRFLGEYWT